MLCDAQHCLSLFLIGDEQRVWGDIMRNLTNWQDGIRSLIWEEQHRQAGRLLHVDNVEEYIDKILVNADFLCLHTLDKCLGFVAYYCKDPATPDAFITLFILAPEVRGSGLAASLINGVTAQSRQYNCSRLKLWVHKNNADALRFYYRQGFRSCARREHMLLMELPICSESGSELPRSKVMET